MAAPQSNSGYANFYTTRLYYPTVFFAPSTQNHIQHCTKVRINYFGASDHLRIFILNSAEATLASLPNATTLNTLPRQRGWVGHFDWNVDPAIAAGTSISAVIRDDAGVWGFSDARTVVLSPLKNCSSNNYRWDPSSDSNTRTMEILLSCFLVFFVGIFVFAILHDRRESIRRQQRWDREEEERSLRYQLTELGQVREGAIHEAQVDDGASWVTEENDESTDKSPATSDVPPYAA